MKSRLLVRISRWLNPASGVLIALLQRSPAVKLVVAAGEYVIASPVGTILKGTFAAAASMGAVNSLAGATSLSSTSASPLSTTVGANVSVAFTILGAQTPAGSFTVSGTVPPGLEFFSTSTGGTGKTSGIVNADSSGAIYLRGSPTTTGSFTIGLRGWQNAGGSGDQSTVFNYQVNVTGSAPATPPTITSDPISQTISIGTNVNFSVGASGTGLSYQWTKNGVAIAGATTSSLVLTNVQTSNSGSYAVTVTNSAGTATSGAATLVVGINPVASSSRLINISTRSLVGTDDNVQIAGFVIGGSVAKKVVVRAAGPALTQFGVGGVLADPVLELKSGQTTIQQNDDWNSTIATDFSSVGAWAWPAGSKDAALVATLQPGAYTAIVSGKNRTSGVALIEVYEADSNPAASLTNISTRSLVGTNSDAQIAGFVVGGTQSKTVVIRVSGPALTQFGVNGVLADPFMELFNAGGTKLADNDNWDASNASDFQRAGAWAWPAGSKDAAIVATLAPGAYTAVVTGKNNGTGVALIEVYQE